MRFRRGLASDVLREHDRHCHGDDPCCEWRVQLQQLQVRRCTDRGSSGRGSTEWTSTRYSDPFVGLRPRRGDCRLPAVSDPGHCHSLCLILGQHQGKSWRSGPCPRDHQRTTVGLIHHRA